MTATQDDTVRKFARAVAKAQGHPDCDGFADKVVEHYNEPEPEPERDEEVKGKKAKKQSY